MSSGSGPPEAEYSRDDASSQSRSHAASPPPPAAQPLPPFVGHRRRLPPGAPLFEYADLERQLALQDAVVQVSAAEEAALMAELRGRGEKLGNRGAAAEAPVCSVCGAALPSGHLLSLHIAEAHDSFFAAQAARKLKVFQCLLETCERKFATAAERKRHLIDVHAFPKGFRFDCVHMRRHKGQVRPAAELRRYTPKAGRRYAQQSGGTGPQDAAADALADDLAHKLQGLGRGGRPPEHITFGRSRHHAPLRGGGKGRGRSERARGRGRGRGRAASVQLD